MPGICILDANPAPCRARSLGQYSYPKVQQMWHRCFSTHPPGLLCASLHSVGSNLLNLNIRIHFIMFPNNAQRPGFRIPNLGLHQRQPSTNANQLTGDPRYRVPNNGPKIGQLKTSRNATQHEHSRSRERHQDRYRCEDVDERRRAATV